MSDDVTPDGDPIETHTLWLEFPEGDAAVTLDVSRFQAAIKRARDLVVPVDSKAKETPK